MPRVAAQIGPRPHYGEVGVSRIEDLFVQILSNKTDSLPREEVVAKVAATLSPTIGHGSRIMMARDILGQALGIGFITIDADKIVHILDDNERQRLRDDISSGARAERSKQSERAQRREYMDADGRWHWFVVGSPEEAAFIASVAKELRRREWETIELRRRVLEAEFG